MSGNGPQFGGGPEAGNQDFTGTVRLGVWVVGNATTRGPARHKTNDFTNQLHRIEG